MKNELERVRDWVEARLRAGAVPGRAWPQHVRLLEALDSMLHELSVAQNGSLPRQYAGRSLRLVQRDDLRGAGHISSAGGAQRKTGSSH